VKFRSIALILLCAIISAVFISLGFWQLGRHRERQAVVASQTRRIAAPPLDRGGALSSDAELDYRRVTLSGRYDVSNEIVVMNRTRQGAPGVHVLTPLLLQDTDTAILVNRGWVYSPDGSSIELLRWRAGIAFPESAGGLSGPVDVSGLLLPFSDSAEEAPPRSGSDTARRMPRLQRGRLIRMLPYPLAPKYVQLLAADSIVRRGVPTPVPPPTLSLGSHLSYAIQWFAFAVICVVGCAALLLRGRGGAYY
jgi:surfeit locus 1 family protein